MAYRLPPLSALRAFEAAARHLSFKLAAQELHVTPGAVSQQIKQLEEYLGLALFVRQTRAVRLTPAGEAMLPKLREGFACLAAAVESTRVGKSGGRLAVTAPPSFASRWLIPRLARFTGAHPEVSLRLSSSVGNIDVGATGSLPVEAVDPRTELSEVAIRFGRGLYPGAWVRRIISERLVAACSPALLKGSHPLREPADLRHHVLIHDDQEGSGLDEGSMWDEWLRAAGVEGVDTGHGPRIANTLALEAAIDGLGVVLALRPLIADAVAEGRLVVPFETSIPSPYAYYLVVPQAMAERPEVLAFCDWVQNEVEESKII